MAASMLQTNQEGGGTYTYSSQPKAVGQGTYRNDRGYGNIMYDKRVVRGNTYAVSGLPASSQPDPLELQRQQEARRRALARKRARDQFKPRSPQPVEGRKHIDAQTELYLETITDRVEEADVKTQTDAFLDRPPTPLFIPAKIGQDAATQIEDGDLFDFNVEVKPILEVLVGKTVEQALLEVLEEEELANLRAQQRIFEENRNAELVETQRLEEQERRRHEEKERRLRQQRDALLKEKETAEKIAARAFAQSYLSDLVPAVFATLSHNGYFYDSVEREVETVFMPWLMDEAEKALDEILVARMVLDALLRELVQKHLGFSATKASITTSSSHLTEEKSAPAIPTIQETTAEPSDNTAEVSGSQHKIFGDSEVTEDENILPDNAKKEVEMLTEDGVAIKLQEDESNNETAKGDTEVGAPFQPHEGVEENLETGEGGGPGEGSEEDGEDTAADENLGEDKPPDTTDD